MSTIGAFICVRNGIELDYCFELAAESLLKVCDQLVLCDSDSTDGTRQALQRMADRDPRITVINWPWPNPVRESHHWFLRWLRYAQSHLTTDYCFYLDADETLQDSPDCHQALKAAAERGECIEVDRINYWRDAQSVVPEGHCCGRWCVRGGPTKYPVVSDEPHHHGEEPIVDNKQREPAVIIHHLGFLRRKDAFYRKAKVVLHAWFGRHDTRLENGENEGKQLWETECEFTNQLVPFHGYQPEAVQRWLAARGHFTEKYVPLITTPPDAPIEITEERAEKEPIGILHFGDYGDVVAMLPICKALGNVNLYFQDRNSICKRILERLHVIAPLLEAQPYINVAKPHEGEPIHWLAGDFRVHHDLARSLAWAHFMHYLGQRGLPAVTPDFTSPWLTAQPDPRATGKVIINRTSRYNNRFFRWGDILKHYNTSLLFIGTREEHTAFCNTFGPVTYQPTADLLEAARLIAGSALFIGNQSACFAIAEGLKHPRLLEVCLYQPDVIVQANQEGLYLSADGSVNLPAVGQHRPLLLTSAITTVDYLKNPMMQPRTGWYVGQTWAPTYWALKKMLRKGKPGMDDNDAHRIAYDALAEREPEYFDNSQQRAELNLFHEAVGNAL
jgi:glycosyltransferase involved in cell wall biosynthesis